MLGGMSGGGMAFIVNPEIRDLFKQRVAEIMLNSSNYIKFVPVYYRPGCV
jgi:hypothetical protein